MKKLLTRLCITLSLFGSLAVGADFRPSFHFTPEKNWMNDPNGMVFYDGEYHLFYQYNPFGDRWGHMSWGHAVSRDLLNWEELPLAIPEDGDVMIFSGSCVIDWDNTSGFGRDGKPPMVAIYTGARPGVQDQRLAYSNDRGRTWTQYEGNPVLDPGEADFRDPKVFWHESTRRWIMAVTLSLERKVLFYSSPDLKKWTWLSDFGPVGSVAGIWECPDLFPLPVENASGEERWVLLVNVGSGAPAGGSGCQYFTGTFDGRRFVADRLPAARPAEIPDGRVMADFEGGGFSEWTAEGDAFGVRPARGALPGQNPVAGFEGAGLASSFHGGDGSEGRLVSPSFEIDRDFVSFLIGGGAQAGRTCLNLVVDGEVVRSATGEDDETLQWKSWDVSALRGRTARIEAVDLSTGGWGHVSFDQVVLGDSPARPAREGALWADFGPDYYATVTWSDVPEEDGRRLAIGWMSNWIYAEKLPTSPWRGAMTIPRELTLRSTEEGLRLVQRPVREIVRARRDAARFGPGTLAELNRWLGDRDFPQAMEIEFELQVPPSGSAGLKIASGGDSTTVRANPSEGTLLLDRSGSGRTDFHGKFPAAFEAPVIGARDGIRLRVVLDRSSIEIFANDGLSSITALRFPPGGPIRIEALGGDGVQVPSFEAWEIAPEEVQ